jgi:hypothetical protein
MKQLITIFVIFFTLESYSQSSIGVDIGLNYQAGSSHYVESDKRPIYLAVPLELSINKNSSLIFKFGYAQYLDKYQLEYSPIFPNNQSKLIQLETKINCYRFSVLQSKKYYFKTNNKIFINLDLGIGVNHYSPKLYVASEGENFLELNDVSSFNNEFQLKNNAPFVEYSLGINYVLTQNTGISLQTNGSYALFGINKNLQYPVNNLLNGYSSQGKKLKNEYFGRSFGLNFSWKYYWNSKSN